MERISSILIIEDNETDQIIAERAIKRYDKSIAIYLAFDGLEALELLKELEQQPDIIFLDINMPGMDGHEFLAEYAKTSSQATTVAMLTSSDQSAEKEKCMAYSFVKEYIVKPLDVGDVKRISLSILKNNDS